MTPLLESLGGIGLFLFGMAVMSSGLRKLAGDRLRGWLGRSTRNPVTGVLTGAGATALVQSSSATTVAAIGFVSAGLLTFPQALAVIFGANVGTTLTGWIVALFGFKLKLSAVALPLLFLSSLFYLYKSNRRLRGLGKALSGFCLIFIGISYLQDGLAAYRDVIDLSAWAADRLSDRLVLLLIGVVLTLITQSSSATVATAITALHAGVLDLPQAAAVIIGADIGTTATAMLATIGGTVEVRRTGFAHVIYNVLTGIMAFFIFTPYLWSWDRLAPGFVSGSPEVVAVGFHSFFNIFGVILVLPFTRSFARFITWLIPGKTPPLVALFDQQLLGDPGASVAALEVGTQRLATTALRSAGNRLDPKMTWPAPPNESIFEGVEAARDFAVQIGSRSEESHLATDRIFACLHIIDHVERLIERVSDLSRARSALSNSQLAEQAKRLAASTGQLAEGIALADAGSAREALRRIATALEDDKSGFRAKAIASAASGKLSASELDHALDAQRWLRRVAYHAWRIADYSR